MQTEYKTVCDKCYMKTWYETEQPCKVTLWTKCGECGQSTDDSKPYTCSGTLRVIDNTDVSDYRLKSAYENQNRIEITYKDGSKVRCRVGKSTGWKPIFLAIKTSRSTGGERILVDFIKEVRTV